jgi:hypothetical protein
MTTADAGALDSVGRQILSIAEYRSIGVLIAAILVAFVFWRRYKFNDWPGVENCFYVFGSVVAVIGGFLVGVVFLLTKPPAIELLSSQALLSIGIFVPVVSFGYGFPRLRTLFSPPAAPTPPPQDPQKDEALQPKQ